MTEFEIKQDYSADEALDILADRSHLHPNIRKFFGNGLTDEFLEIFEDPEIFELDAMLLQGDLTVAEMEEYLMLLPSYHALNRQIVVLANKLVAHLTRDLNITLYESTDKYGNIKNNRGLVRLQKSVFDMLEGFENKNCGTKRNALVHFIKNYIGQALITEIWYKVVLNPGLAKYKPLVSKFITEVDRNFKANMGFNYPGIIALQMISSFRTAYQNHHSEFSGFLDEAEKEKSTRVPEPALVESINEDFRAIDRLSQFRKINAFSRKYGDAIIEIYGGEFKNDTKSVNVAYVKVSFPGANPDIKLRPRPNLSDGSYIVETKVEHDSFQFAIDRDSGNFLIGASLLALDNQSAENRGEPFISKEEFLRMKAVIFRILREYLEGKPEDVDKVFFKSTQKTGELQKQTREKIDGVVPVEKDLAAEETAGPESGTGQEAAAQPEIPADTVLAATAQPEIPAQPTYIYQPYVAPAVAEPSGESAPAPAAQPLIIQDIRLDGVYREEETIAAISRITKIPPLKSARNKQRGKGSHVVMQGQNGNRFPLPCHSGKDLSPAILKRCLQRLEIPYSLFKAEY